MPSFTPPPGTKQMAQQAKPPAPRPTFPPPLPRRITGEYTAEQVRDLPGELEIIEGSIPPGRYLCTWVEDEL